MSNGTESAQKFDADRRRAGDRAQDGQSTAAEKLFADSRAANKGSSGGQFDNQLIAELEQQGILPQLAIEFTNSADANDLDGDGDITETVFSAIDTDGQDGITEDELQVARTSDNASVLDKRLIQQLGTDYATLRLVTETGVDGISQDDVNAYIANKDTELANDTRVRDAGARLLLNPDLFKLADTASDGGTGDGSISRDDLETLIDKYGRGELPSTISQEDIDAMQFLVDNWDESFVGGDDSGIRDTDGERDTQKGTGLTRASIQVGLGVPVDGSGNQALYDQVANINAQYSEQYASAYSTKYGEDFPSAEESTTNADESAESSTTSECPAPAEQPDTPSPTSGTPTEQTDTPSPTSGTPSITESTTDANGTKITTYKGHVTYISYADGQARDFGHNADGDLVSYKDADGKIYRRDDPSSPWVAAGDGKPAPFFNVEVDQAGNVTVTNTDGSTTTYNTKNEQSSLNADGEAETSSTSDTTSGASTTAEAETASEEDASSEGGADSDGGTHEADSVATYTVQSGQGFDRIAREVYMQALGHEPSAAEERALSELIAAANNNDRSYSSGVLQPGDELVVPNLQQLALQATEQGVPLDVYIRNTSEQITSSLQAPEADVQDTPASTGDEVPV